MVVFERIDAGGIVRAAQSNRGSSALYIASAAAREEVSRCERGGGDEELSLDEPGGTGMKVRDTPTLAKEDRQNRPEQDDPSRPHLPPGPPVVPVSWRVVRGMRSSARLRSLVSSSLALISMTFETCQWLSEGRAPAPDWGRHRATKE